MSSSKLLQAATLGGFKVQNRIAMAPMTRGRASHALDKDLPAQPQAIMAQYYIQRSLKSGAGLTITEGTIVTPRGHGWVNAPGIWSQDQVDAWTAINYAVHQANPEAQMVCQLWHLGRVSHSSFQADGSLPWGPSPIAAAGDSHTYEGHKPYEVPHEMTEAEIEESIQAFATAAKNAKEAGFDGVEIHGANGYLVDQFTRSKSNQRSDKYGGSVENRIRFGVAVAKAVVEAFGDASKVGYRVSPTAAYNDMRDEDPIATYTALGKELGALGLGYVHCVEGRPGSMMPPQEDGPQEVAKFIREVLPKSTGFIVNGGYDKEAAEEAIDSGLADVVSFGVPFLANPDLATKFASGEALKQAQFDKMFVGGVHGYVRD